MVDSVVQLYTKQCDDKCAVFVPGTVVQAHVVVSCRKRACSGTGTCGCILSKARL
jgi:hypothetical protein